MVDPLSVAGSSVGVISLGLTICQGLFAYYGPYKSFNNEIKDFTRRIEVLHGLLGSIQIILSDTHAFKASLASETVKIACNIVQHCQQGLLRLDRMLDKCKLNPFPKTSLGAKFHIERAFYPFRRETLMAFLEIVGWLQANLNTALHMLNIAMQIDGQKQMALIAENSAAAAANTGRVLGAALESSQRSGNLDDRFATLDKRIKQVESAVIKHGIKPVTEPATLKSLLDSQRTFDTDMEILVSQTHRQPEQIRMRCLCFRYALPPREGQPFYRFVPAHKAGCPLYIPGQKTRILQARQTFCNRLLKFSILASLNITTGAGGFAISPQLHFRAVVPKDWPAFKLIRDARSSIIKTKNTKGTLQSIYKKLLQVYQDGRSSPTDTIPGGSTVLHMVAEWYSIHCNHWNDSLREAYQEFISNLTADGKFPNCPDDYGLTPADVALVSPLDGWGDEPADLRQQAATVDICSAFLKAGDYLTYGTLLSGDRIGLLCEFWRTRLLWQIVEQNGAEDIYLPEALDPLLTRRPSLLDSLLRKKVDMQWTIDLYTAWPEGLASLLRAGYKPGKMSLLRACEADCAKSIELLASNPHSLLGNDVMNAVKRLKKSHIIELVAHALADRRRRLQSLAVTHLPGDVVAQLLLHPNSPLGFYAAKAYRLLKSSGVIPDASEEEGGWLIYHSVGFNYDMANQLWAAGFLDVDEMDDQGFTSFMKLDDWIGYEDEEDDLKGLFEMAAWLISKGANIDYKRSSSPALHYFGYAFGAGVHNLPGKGELGWFQASDTCLELTKRILLYDSQDTCCCSCSLNGCCAVTRMLAGLFNSEYGFNAWEFERCIKNLSKVLNPECGKIFAEQAPAVLRFLTFQALEIIHTCDHSGNIDPDEIRQLQSEQEDLLMELEQLLLEFIHMYKTLDVSFLDFLGGYWFERMEEVLRTDQLPNQEQISRMREMGVIVHDVESLASGGFIIGKGKEAIR